MLNVLKSNTEVRQVGYYLEFPPLNGHIFVVIQDQSIAPSSEYFQSWELSDLFICAIITSLEMFCMITLRIFLNAKDKQ